MKLYTITYPFENEARRLEHEAVTSLNLGAFARVHVLAENVTDPQFPGEYEFVPLRRRQMFEDLFSWARETCEPDELCVVGNSDIAYPLTSLSLADQDIRESQCYALSRWDLSPRVQLYDQDCSQDSWVFRGPPSVNVWASIDMGGGRPGCDNRIAHEIRAAGYEVLNPSRDVKTYHLHSDPANRGDSHRRVRSHEANRIPGRYLMIKPHSLGEAPTYREVTR